jgi:hypothetical protein
MTNKDLLPLLFSRLTWPSVMARERACVEIAKLYASPQLSREFAEFLVEWIRSQHTETACGLGLLVMLRAQMEGTGATALPAVAELEALIPWPSLQSWLLFAEYEPDRQPKIDLARCHSGDPPASFSPPDFFQLHVRGFVPPIYDNWATTLESRRFISFPRQWAFEWECVLRRRPLQLSTDSLQFWISDRGEDGRLFAMDSPMSEVYRSAYLRALAWAVDSRRLPWVDALWLASETVPIDLDLWKVLPGRRPSWWPGVAVRKELIDTSADDIWRSVDELWATERSGAAAWGSDWSVAFADGRVHSGQSVYDVCVHGFFHKRIDAQDPSTDDVFEWLTTDPRLHAWVHAQSPVRIGGRIEALNAQRLSEEMSGWLLVPAVVGLNRGGAISRWQWWRGFRGLHAPAPCLAERGYEVVCRSDAIEFRDEAQVAARWSDWTDGLSERLKGNLSPATGQVLLIECDRLYKFAADFDATYCWLVRMHVWSREHSYEDYKQVHFDRTYGVGKLILP